MKKTQTQKLELADGTTVDVSLHPEGSVTVKVDTAQPTVTFFASAPRGADVATSVIERLLPGVRSYWLVKRG